jgi:hypothetical protein
MVAVLELVQCDRRRFPGRRYAPECVDRALLQLVAHFGLRRVAREHADFFRGEDGCNGYLAGFFKRARLWRVPGYDR